MNLSVILCTHNPRPSYLQRVLHALARQQDLPPWELILVDNRSNPPLADWVDLKVIPNASLVVEAEPGFTPALIRGTALARADICLLIHDDNVLPPCYLAEVLSLAQAWPKLGAWGGGFEPEFEENPDSSLEPFLLYLAVNPVRKERWSNALYDYEAVPAGAGMAVRTNVLRHYCNLVRTDDQRRSLGRHSGRLTSCEDFDIAFTAIDLGYGTGVFPSLHLTHLIPRERVQKDYLERLVEGHAYSTVLLHSFRGPVQPPRRGIVAWIRRWRRQRKLTSNQRRVDRAYAQGEKRAHAALAQDGPDQPKYR